ncbi:MAG TPA: hypothetical protein VFH51_17040 [Myxococcota bacterium]|nr:hypothetical protein [Myxococcota bacterium]
MRRSGLKRALVAAAAVLLAATVAVASGGEHGHGGDALTINWWEWSNHKPPMGWFLLDFGLFLFGLVYFAGKPLSQAFSQRHLGIKKAISDAAAAHAKARETHQELRARLSGLDAELRALTSSNQQDGEAERAQLVKDAQAYAERMKKDSGSMAGQELQRAQERLRHEVAAQALVRAEALLQRELTAADQQTLIDQAIEELESGAPLRSVKRAKAGLQLVTGGAA